MNTPSNHDAVLGRVASPSVTSAVLGGFYSAQRKFKAGEQLTAHEKINIVLAHKCRNLDELLVKIAVLQEYHNSKGLDFDWLTEGEIAIALQHGARKSFYLNVGFLTSDRDQVKKIERRILSRAKKFVLSHYSPNDLVKKALLDYLGEESAPEEKAFNYLASDSSVCSIFPSSYPVFRSPAVTFVVEDGKEKVYASSIGKLSLKHNTPFTLVWGVKRLLTDIARTDEDRTLLRQFTLFDFLLAASLLAVTPVNYRDLQDTLSFRFSVFSPSSFVLNKWLNGGKGEEVLRSLAVGIPNLLVFSAADRQEWVSNRIHKSMPYAIALHAAHKNTVAYNLKHLEQKLGIWNLHKTQDHLAAQVVSILPALRDVVDLIVAEFKEEIESGESPTIPIERIEAVEQDFELLKLTLS